MADEAEPGGTTQLAAAISDALVALHVRYYGKGPKEARTYFGGDYVFCVLVEPFTTVEQTLIEVGWQQSVRSMRQSFQDAMKVRFTKAIEELTGRRVSAFMSQTDVGPDLAVEIFKFEGSGAD